MSIIHLLIYWTEWFLSCIQLFLILSYDLEKRTNTSRITQQQLLPFSWFFCCSSYWVKIVFVSVLVAEWQVSVIRWMVYVQGVLTMTCSFLLCCDKLTDPWITDIVLTERTSSQTSWADCPWHTGWNYWGITISREAKVTCWCLHHWRRNICKEKSKSMCFSFNSLYIYLFNYLFNTDCLSLIFA